MKLKVLTGVTHERYQSYMGGIPHDFIVFELPPKKWDYQYAQLPDNHRLITNITPDIIPDIVLSQHKFGQFQNLSRIAQGYNLPLISLEHMLPNPNWGIDKFNEMRNMSGGINIFLSDLSAKAWRYNEHPSTHIVRQAVDTDVFNSYKTTRSNNILSVVNEYKIRNRECNYDGWLQITKDMPTKLVGSSSDGTSKPALNIKELVANYNNSYIFLNTSRVSTMPFTLFEAMACGCCCISSATSMIPEVIKHGENGFLYPVDQPYLARKLIQKLQTVDPEFLLEIGQNARNTVLKDFSMEKFVIDWTNIIEKTYYSFNKIGRTNLE